MLHKRRLAISQTNRHRRRHRSRASERVGGRAAGVERRASQFAASFCDRQSDRAANAYYILGLMTTKQKLARRLTFLCIAIDRLPREGVMGTRRARPSFGIIILGVASPFSLRGGPLRRAGRLLFRNPCCPPRNIRYASEREAGGGKLIRTSRPRCSGKTYLMV